jgi:hypothetical protein
VDNFNAILPFVLSITVIKQIRIRRTEHLTASNDNINVIVFMETEQLSAIQFGTERQTSRWEGSKGSSVGVGMEG